MMNVCRWFATSVAVAVGVCTLGGNARSWAQDAPVPPTPTTPTEATPSQPVKAAPQAATLVGQCRAVNKRTPIYSNRNPVSEALVLLQRDNAVILGENGGSNGMISVNRPRKGYVHTANLKLCAAKPEPPTTTKAGLCRQVLQQRGMVVRSIPGNSAPIVGGLKFNQKVTLSNPIASRQLNDGRVWVKITSPVNGWTSNGFVTQQFRNLGACQA
ncbi:SH3 domain-containing protein [filamentous cyanobacterium LEGE 11480]|uniref:SH3 domain-containing protein n=1 Tax=Romeriopsis navalis LEGE 11480 TaxID=2777977 RepID=A0A928Z1F6_9CYAN|nr:SH3 domain-containing protein [Romeriopsis navalis]MBE9028459.1 SH3 domain-containing protein [Romeriopsis navalis LEGE 11480]